MKDETILLIKLINENKTLNEISDITGLSHKQLFTKFSMLKKIGYLIDRSYCYNGDIKYSIKNPFFTPKENLVKIEIDNDITNFKMLIMSDLHLGHINDNLEALYKSFEYCIKEDIHTIINLGDFFNGVYESDIKNIKHSNSFEQIKYVLNNYPYVENILTYLCLGNHDAKIWFEDGLDIKEILLDRRHDIIPIGYGRGKIDILNSLIYLTHPIEKIKITSTGETVSNNIILRGHSHKFKIDTGNNLTINVPSLSNLACYDNDGMHVNPPSMLELELKIALDTKKIQTQTIKQLIYVNNDFIKIGEFHFCQILKQKNTNNVIIPTPQLNTFNNMYNDILTKTLKR